MTMKKFLMGACTLGLSVVLTGCGKTGSGVSSTTITYAAAALLALLLLLGYCWMDRKRDGWFLLLFSSVVVVNIGYFALSISHSLDEALLANRIAYLGSVCLPMAMLMIIMNVTRLRYKRWLPFLLLGLAVFVFLIAASPGYLDIYYKEVALVTVDGVSALDKVYGPFHCLYGLYLLGYFAAMVAAIIHAAVANKLESAGHAAMLTIAVLANLGVWFVEQLTDFDFEFLSISYIISELFLLGLHMMVAENQHLKNLVTQTEQALTEAIAEVSPSDAMKARLAEGEAATEDRLKVFADGLLELTQTERSIYDAYIARVTTKEIMASLNIKENTLKFHNKNLYQKLGVSSRKQLQELHKQMISQ